MDPAVQKFDILDAFMAFIFFTKTATVDSPSPYVSGDKTKPEEKDEEPISLLFLPAFRSTLEEENTMVGDLPLLFSIIVFLFLPWLIRRRMNVQLAAIAVLCVLWSPPAVVGVRFAVARRKCFSKNVPYEGDTIRVSFVVIKIDSWKFSEAGVDLVVKDSRGMQIRESRGKFSDMFNFSVRRKGLLRFCFFNNSPNNEIVDFEIQVVHFAYREDNAGMMK
ncbi:transmembrane emp24 domain-containing protein p24beta2-like [Wolffia australiana]